MDPLDTMTGADWRRVYERTQEYATSLLDQGVALRRREVELVDRLRRREDRVRELEEENQRLRDTAAVARYVADHCREFTAGAGWAVASHPLCLVLTALNGETEPEKLGLDEEDRSALEWARDIAKETA